MPETVQVQTLEPGGSAHHLYSFHQAQLLLSLILTHHLTHLLYFGLSPRSNSLTSHQQLHVLIIALQHTHVIHPPIFS